MLVVAPYIILAQMGLTAGTKLGPYEIQSPLGAGGMGEVYRARDTRLERSVAVKVLPSHLANQPEAAERFEREARTISSLNHPNICQLHDVGAQEGVRFLVMELLEGETLSERLRRGPLPLEQTLRYSAEIAEGLAAAHRRGVLHRDLKPGNIMLTKSGAKLMDFGLAKGARVASPVSTELTATLTTPPASPLTQQGTIVGTFQYMAPEQVEGNEADERSDIFSLGAVLYEMISGRRAFEGKTLVSVAAAILEKEPEPIRNLQPGIPPALERVIKKCLVKDPAARWQNAGDLASELGWIEEGGASSGSHAVPVAGGHVEGSGRLPWAVAAAALLATVAIAGFHFGFREQRPVIRTQIAPSNNLEFNFVGDSAGPPVISPDGSRIVFSARGREGQYQLFVRAMDKMIPEPIAATDGATYPFWSPDSRSIGFFADGKLKRAELGGGPAVTLADAQTGRGGAWSKNGMMVYEPFATVGLMAVPASGGTAKQVTTLSGKYTTNRWPSFLPDGRHFLYLAANHTSPTSNETAVFWASLDGKDNKLVVRSPSSAIYASGYLLYVSDNALVAQAFDPASGELKGELRILNDDVQVDRTIWRGTFSASENGTLLYQPSANGGAGVKLTWLDRTGKQMGEPLGPDSFYEVALSPDDKKAAVSIQSSSMTIWVYDLVHNTRTRLTYGNDFSVDPVWSHDGKEIAYVDRTFTGGFKAIMAKAADGSSERQLAVLDPEYGPQQALLDWSPDGKSLLLAGWGVGEGINLWVVPTAGNGKAARYAAGSGSQSYGKFSPDGRWVAYASTETGLMELYVAPFPWTGAKWQISSGGGTAPFWRRDGKELFFDVFGSNREMVAEVNGHGSSFEVNGVKTLAEINNLSPSVIGATHAVTSDGQRFLWITTSASGRLPLTVIQNWTAELKK